MLNGVLVVLVARNDLDDIFQDLVIFLEMPCGGFGSFFEVAGEVAPELIVTNLE